MKILIPVDDSDFARRAVELVARWAEGGGAVEVVLAHVRSPADYYSELTPVDHERIDRAQREAQQRLLARALEQAQRLGLQQVALAAAQGYAADEIVRVAREKGVDQIVMGTHGRGAVGSFLLGSVAQRVVHLAPMPVTMVK